MATLEIGDLIFLEIEKIQPIFGSFMAQEGVPAGAFTAINELLVYVAGALETQALIARASGKTAILDGQLSLDAAVRRASDLRGLIDS